MKDKSDGSGNTLLWIVVLIVLLLIIAFGITKLSGGDAIDIADENEGKGKQIVTTVATTTLPETTVTTTTTTEALPDLGITGNDLYSSAAVLMDKDGKVLYEFNHDERIYPASLTKIMTALVAIENMDNINDTITIPGDIYDYINAENASTAGFYAYETVTFNDLLHGTLLSSGAECSLALAVYLGGSEEMFVRMMNEKAKEIGMENTNFTNVCGLHNYEHYSTAEDMAILLNYALKNSEFKSIFTTPDYYTTTDYHTDGIMLSSTMFSQMDYYSFEGGEFLGGKTGYTSEAGYCLASLAEVSGEEYTLITVGAGGEYYYDTQNIYDARTVYEALASCK